MRELFNLLKINSLVLGRLWGTWLFLVIGILLFTIVFVGDIEGSGRDAQFSFRALIIPARLFLITFSLLEILLGLFALITTFVLADKLLSGQFLQIYLSRFQNRVTYLIAFLLTLLLLIGISTAGYLLFFIRAEFTLTHALYAYFAILMMLYSICLMLITLLNFTTTRKLSLLILLFMLFLVKPALAYAEGIAVNLTLLSNIIYMIGYAATFPFRFIEFSDQLIRLGYLEPSLFWYPLTILIALIVANSIWFVRKDLVDN